MLLAYRTLTNFEKEGARRSPFAVFDPYNLIMIPI